MKPILSTDKYKQTFFSLVIYIFWVIGFAFYSFIEEKQELYNEIDQKLIAAAQITPLLLPKKLHHRGMIKNKLNRKVDISNRAKLSAYTDNNDVVYIYTLILQSKKIFFTSSSATKEERETGEGLTKFLDHYDDVDPRVHNVFSSQEKLFIEHSDQWGTFRSVFLPLQANDGSLYISAADIAIDHISAQLQTTLRRTLIIALLFFVFAFPIYFTATKKIKRLVNKLAKKVQQQTTELADNSERLQLAMIASKQGWFDLNITNGDVIVSSEYSNLLGFSPDTFKTNLQKWQENIHPDDINTVLRVYQDTLEGKKHQQVEYRRKKNEGGWAWINSIGLVVERDENGDPIRMVGIHADVTERKRSELMLRALAESGSEIDQEFFQKIIRELAISHDIRYAYIACFDKNTTESVSTLVMWADDQFIDNFSYSLKETPCAHVTEKTVVFHPTGIQKLFPNDPMLVDIGAVSYIGVPLISSNGDVLGLLAMIDDKPMEEDSHRLDLLGSFSVRVSTELERRESDKKIKLSAQVFKAAHEGIVITDAAGIIVDVNPTFCDITCYQREEVIGQKPSILASGKHSHEFFVEMWQIILSQGYWQGELWNRKKNGQLYAELLTISAILDEQGKPQNYIGLFSDITKNKEQQKSLELMAHYDLLTGLPNRSLLADRYQHAVARSKRSKTLLAVCFLDLDGFKPVNDKYGHIVGDQLLKKAAGKIKLILREEDTISRIGGDEFALLLCDLTSADQCRQMLNRLHYSLSQIFTVEGHEISISASSGITLYPHDEADLDTLLRHADKAMYQAKLAGRNRYQFFDSNEDQQQVDKQQRLQDIKMALLNGEMQLFYQPKVNMKTGEIIGFEALIRWFHPKQGLIPPLEFLPAIQNTAIEVQLGEWVIKTALQQINSWHELGFKIEVSVNISSYHLQASSFIPELTTALASYPTIYSKFLQLEILESSALGDLTAISNIIRTCRDNLGVQIALDDFGTGYSSLTHLRNLSANIIKIDRNFVIDILDDIDDCAIIEGIIGLANAFNLEVIAEGVETAEHGTMLLAMGCHQAQGYGIAKPMPVNQVLDWINLYKPNAEWMHFAKKEYIPEANKIKLFQLCFQHWYKLFSEQINRPLAKEDAWPIMSQLTSHHSIRYEQFKQEQILNKVLLNTIDKDYKSFQLLAIEMFDQYQRGDVDGAITKLNRLDILYHKICEQIENTAFAIK